MWACTGPSACTCAGFTQLPQGSYAGPKQNVAAAARVSQQGFSTLNANTQSILEQFAPGGDLIVPVPCSLQDVPLFGFSVAKLAVGDTGNLGCTAESCGRMDGVCDARDLGQQVTLHFNSLSFSSKSPDLLEAKVSATVQTGRLPISSVGNSVLLCLSSSRAKFTVDLDTARAAPASTDLLLDIRLSIDTRWDQLVALEVASVGNVAACSGSTVPPNCIDPNDMEILNEGCSSLSIAQLGPVKSLLINQLAGSLKDQITAALADANCAPCGAGNACPSFNGATSTCETDAGVCRDDFGGKCVPGLLGVEGRLEVGQLLATAGAPADSAITLSLGAGGNVESSTAGLSIGVRGGAKEVTVASCVRPLTRAAPTALTLPNFDTEAPGPYDIGLSLSDQMVDELLFRAQQSGALCLELSTDTVAALESDLLAALLPSLKLVTAGANVPLRVVIRPVNPPTATVGEGTFDNTGTIISPLLRLEWVGVEIDIYALIAERQTRVFTVSADLSLPLGVELDGCSGATPVVGSLMGAVTNVQVKNSELLAEDTAALQALVPTLLTLAEPALSGGLTAFTLPEFNGFQLKLDAARGISRIPNTNTYLHAAFFAELIASQSCTPMTRRSSTKSVEASKSAHAEVQVEASKRFAWRVDSGLWVRGQSNDTGVLSIDHPRLMLGKTHVVDILPLP